MEIIITRTIEALLLPPGCFIILIVLGLLTRGRRGSSGFLVLAFVGLYALSVPITAQSLMSLLETYPPLTIRDIDSSRAEAIVVLGAGRYGAPEYTGESVNAFALERLRYGVRLHRLTDLPIIVSGGDPLNEGSSEASLMKQALQIDFQMKQVRTEGASRNTAENAFFTRQLLDELGMKRVYLVTHAFHMPRAVQMFEQAGVHVIPAPLHFLSLRSDDASDLVAWLPTTKVLERSYIALHELLGKQWYRMRHSDAAQAVVVEGQA